ncbi:hypothetical protein Sjap_011681 [Stephania japonica]|uniref:Uncharacterized protein n=1 Tax=Stephania japonica TaxID=461633 RepID=A0AAP0JC23_9MAGN
MAPEHLLATFAKLCSEILAAVPDGLLNLNDVTAQSVLKMDEEGVVLDPAIAKGGEWWLK